MVDGAPFSLDRFVSSNTDALHDERRAFLGGAEGRLLRFFVEHTPQLEHLDKRRVELVSLGSQLSLEELSRVLPGALASLTQQQHEVHDTIRTVLDAFCRSIPFVELERALPSALISIESSTASRLWYPLISAVVDERRALHGKTLELISQIRPPSGMSPDDMADRITARATTERLPAAVEQLLNIHVPPGWLSAVLVANPALVNEPHERLTAWCTLLERYAETWRTNGAPADADVLSSPDSFHTLELLQTRLEALGQRGPRDSGTSREQRRRDFLDTLKSRMTRANDETPGCIDPAQIAAVSWLLVDGVVEYWQGSIRHDCVSLETAGERVAHHEPESKLSKGSIRRCLVTMAELGLVEAAQHNRAFKFRPEPGTGAAWVEEIRELTRDFHQMLARSLSATSAQDGTEQRTTVPAPDTSQDLPTIIGKLKSMLSVVEEVMDHAATPESWFEDSNRLERWEETMVRHRESKHVPDDMCVFLKGEFNDYVARYRKSRPLVVPLGKTVSASILPPDWWESWERNCRTLHIPRVLNTLQQNEKSLESTLPALRTALVGLHPWGLDGSAVAALLGDMQLNGWAGSSGAVKYPRSARIIAVKEQLEPLIKILSKNLDERLASFNQGGPGEHKS